MVLDVMKHSAKAPSTHCSFRHKISDPGSRYGFSVNIHHENTSYRRTLARSLSLRLSHISHEEASYLGMKNGTMTHLHAKAFLVYTKTQHRIDESSGSHFAVK